MHCNIIIARFTVKVIKGRNQNDAIRVTRIFRLPFNKLFDM